MHMDESEQLYPEQSTTAIVTYHGRRSTLAPDTGALDTGTLDTGSIKVSGRYQGCHQPALIW